MNIETELKYLRYQILIDKLESDLMIENERLAVCAMSEESLHDNVIKEIKKQLERAKQKLGSI